MEIQDIIKKRREELNLTYEEIGNIVGVSKSTVRKWETGMIENMRRDKIVLLAKALHVSVQYLMGMEYDDKDNASKNADKDSFDNYGKPSYLEEYEKLFPEGFRMIRRAATDLTDKDKEKLIQIMKAYLDD